MPEAGLRWKSSFARNDLCLCRCGPGTCSKNTGAGLTRWANTPGGRRQHKTCDGRIMVSGVEPFGTRAADIPNTAAFRDAEAGHNGNIERNSAHGPRIRQGRMRSSPKHARGGDRAAKTAHGDLHLFNHANGRASGAAAAETRCRKQREVANRVQPPCRRTSAAAGRVWPRESTVGKTDRNRTTNRQIQLAFRMHL